MVVVVVVALAAMVGATHQLAVIKLHQTRVQGANVPYNFSEDSRFDDCQHCIQKNSSLYCFFNLMPSDNQHGLE
jgi:DTW domain-containing protein YfiP